MWVKNFKPRFIKKGLLAVGPPNVYTFGVFWKRFGRFLMESWISDIEFERLSPIKRAIKAAVINPFANYMPAGFLKALLRYGESELARSNWRDPGGWRSMVISYDGDPEKLADKLLVGAGTMSMALRNRRLLAGRLIARLIDNNPNGDDSPVHVLCLGAGPGRIIIDAMIQADRDSFATLVDLNSDAFEYGHAIAKQADLDDKVHFIEGDVRDVKGMLERPPDIVKMIGICEYLDDEHITNIVQAVADVMPEGSNIIFNSISMAHGNDRFFRRVFGLNMIHRTPEQLQALMEPVGFSDFKSIREPLGVYHVIVGRRSSATASS